MGLDNGITLYSKKAIAIPDEVQVLETSMSGPEFGFGYELCYWRKCWGLRREIAHALQATTEYVGKSWLTISDVKSIWRAITEVNSERTWEDGNNLWTYKEIKPNLERSLLALEWLVSFMREHEGEDWFMVEFYDSY